MHWKTEPSLSILLFVLQHVGTILGNDLETHNEITSADREQILNKQVYAAVPQKKCSHGNDRSTIWTVFSTRSGPRCYNRDKLKVISVTSVEAESNTSTVTLRVVGGDEKGSFESETVNYGHESHGSRTQKCLHWQGPGAIVNDSPVFSSDRAPNINKPATVWQ
jgi:hypothetical protein